MVRNRQDDERRAGDLRRAGVRHGAPGLTWRRSGAGSGRGRISTPLIACAFSYDAHASELEQHRPHYRC